MGDPVNNKIGGSLTDGDGRCEGGGLGSLVTTTAGGEHRPPPEPPDSDAPMEEKGSFVVADVELSQGKVDSLPLPAAATLRSRTKKTIGRSERIPPPESNEAMAEGESPYCLGAMQWLDVAEGTQTDGRMVMEKTRPARPPLESPDRGAPATEVMKLHTLVAPFLLPAADKVKIGAEARAKGALGIMDLTFNLMGQAQTSLTNSAYEKRRVNVTLKKTRWTCAKN